MQFFEVFKKPMEKIDKQEDVIEKHQWTLPRGPSSMHLVEFF